LPNIIIIDDDQFSTIITDTLTFRGHTVKRFGTASEVLDNLDVIVLSDLVVLDIVMPCPASLMGLSVSDPRCTGMILYRQLRSLKTVLPILVYSGIQHKEIIDLLSEDKHTKFLSRWNTRDLMDVISAIEKICGPANIDTIRPRAFIVHGHNEVRKLELKNYLQNILGLPEPIILHEKPDLGRTIIEKFEDYAHISDLVFVLLTPDDTMSTSNQTNDQKRRARQNVIFELGFFMGFIGRKTGRIFILHDGPLDIPTDLSGIIYIDISGGIESAGERIRREVNNVP
jgi:CheY-like chemotaxis protein